MKPLNEIKQEILEKYHCMPDDDNAILILSDALDELLKEVAIQSWKHGKLSANANGGHKPDHLTQFETLIGIRQ